MCEIEIDRIEGANYDPALGQFQGINVVGSVRNCPPTYTDPQGRQWSEVAVEVVAGGETREEVVRVLTEGNRTESFVWTALFKDIPCGGLAEVEARCLGGPADCVAQFQGEMECGEPLCPSVTFDAVEDAGCVDGQRRITITATVQGPPLSQFAVWRFGASNTAVSDFSNSNQTTAELSFRPQDLEHDEVVFELNPDCAYPLTVGRGLLRTCEGECPEVEFETIEDGGCDESERRVIRVTARYSGPAIDGYVVWRYGVDRQATSYAGGENEVTGTLLFEPDDLEEREVVLELTPECRTRLTLSPELLLPCSPDPGVTEVEDEPEAVEGGSCFCVAWLVFNVLLMLATGVALVVAGCIPEPVSITTAVVLAIVTFFSWLFFWLVCLRSTGDCALARWASFLLDGLATVAFVAGVILGIATLVVEVTLGCFIGALIAFAYYGLIALWFKNIVIMMGCYGPYLPWEDE